MPSTNNRKVKPPLLAILICERILVDQEKIATLVRIVDTFNIEIGVEDPEQTDTLMDLPISVALKCSVLTRWGIGQGKFTEELRLVRPDGTEVGGLVTTFEKPEGFHFHQINHSINIGLNTSGIFAFRAYLDGELAGEHPFMVNIRQRKVDAITQ